MAEIKTNKNESMWGQLNKSLSEWAERRKTEVSKSLIAFYFSLISLPSQANFIATVHDLLLAYTK